MEQLGQDLRFAARSLRSRPTFTVIAIATLALGIGATTAMFTVVNAVMLRRLPYAEPERLVQVWETGADEARGEVPTSAPNFMDWRERSRTLQELGAFRFRPYTLTGAGEPEQLTMPMITPSLLRVLGVQPLRGRWFTEEEGQPGGAPAVLLSYGFWQRRFGGSESIVGRTVVLNGVAHTVVGIMPDSFRFPLPTMYPILRRAHVEAWVPFPMSADEPRGLRAFGVLGRLAPTASLEQARSELQTIHSGLMTYRANDGYTTRVVPLMEQVAGELRRPLLILFGAVGLLLVVACVNVANLVTARTAARSRELAVRMALGAGRTRVIRLLVTESVVLGVAGGAIGLLVGNWGVNGLLALLPEGFPRMSEIGVDTRVAAFTFVVSLASAIAFGTWPAWRAARTPPQAAMTGGGRAHTLTRRSRHGADTLVAAQLAISLVLLTGVGLLMRSFVRLTAVDPGFDTEHLITGTMPLAQQKYGEHARQVAFYDAVLERVRALPGVRAATVTGLVPFGGAEEFSGFRIVGREPPADGSPTPARFYVVDPDYFAAMRIRLVRGRALLQSDRVDDMPVVVMNRTAAQRYWPNEDAVGRQIIMGADRIAMVVGIVDDIRFSSLDAEGNPEMYVSYRQQSWPFMGLVVRARGNERALASALRNAVREVDPDQPLADVRPMSRMIADSYAQRRFNMLLLGLFSALALILSAVGLYGVLSQTVARRAPEIGVRMAMGAEPHAVVRMIVGRGMVVTASGLAIGLLVTLPLTAIIRAQLFGITAHDPLTFAAVPTVLAIVAFLASYIPARRAARVDPMIALRE